MFETSVASYKDLIEDQKNIYRSLIVQLASIPEKFPQPTIKIYAIGENGLAYEREEPHYIYDSFYSEISSTIKAVENAMYTTRKIATSLSSFHSMDFSDRISALHYAIGFHNSSDLLAQIHFLQGKWNEMREKNYGWYAQHQNRNREFNIDSMFQSFAAQEDNFCKAAISILKDMQFAMEPLPGIPEDEICFLFK